MLIFIVSKSILLVDDDEVLKENLQICLVKSGYTVYTLKNGEECLNFIKNTIPNILIIDCFMPKMDGLTTIKLMQNINVNIPIIMISSDDIKPKGFLFLRKPFKFHSLLDLIQSILNTKIN